ncbi:hypothetical protein X975_22753, partial [Stegodyphus mimosarum]
MSYGRKKRSTSIHGQADPGRTLTVTNEVTVMDEDHRIPRSSGTGIVEEELPPPKAPSSQNGSPASATKSILPAPIEYLIGGAALVVSLLVSVCVNIYLLLFIRRKLDRNSDSESTRAPSVHESPFTDTLFRSNLYDYYNPKLEWKFESREILYP